MRIGEFFIENQVITEAQLDEALKLQKSCNGKRVGVVLNEMGVISKEN